MNRDASDLLAELVAADQRIKELEFEIRSVLVDLDHLAGVWGDEGVFRRCRDSLRNVVNKTQDTRHAIERGGE